MRLRLFVAALLLSSTAALHADTLASVSPDNLSNLSAGYIGQSFTVVGSGLYQNIAFSFYSPSLTPFATGTGFMLSQAFTGSVASLSSSAAGYLGSVAGSAGSYTFSSLTLTAGVKYYFYENALIPSLSLGGNSSGNYTGGGIYTAALPTTTFTGDPSTQSAFIVTGTPVPAVTTTPEPSSFVLLGTGLLGAAGALKRRFA